MCVSASVLMRTMYRHRFIIKSDVQFRFAYFFCWNVSIAENELWTVREFVWLRAYVYLFDEMNVFSVQNANEVFHKNNLSVI